MGCGPLLRPESDCAIVIAMPVGPNLLSTPHPAFGHLPRFAEKGTRRTPPLGGPPMTLFGHVITWPALYGQLLIGLINGSFYALLSLGLAVIFGMLQIVNFAHGAFYMMGAFAAYFLLQLLGLNYWFALILSPLIIGALGAVVERLFLKRLAGFDPLYSLLLTFGLALIFQGLFQNYFGASGMPYAIPKQLSAAPTTSASCSCPSIAAG